ncbi:phosphatidate cytidylyltransferase [Novosphingobium kunmingense]|uniref:Phosphatidate cytidylyltransferase n=1 Tax=Novosphingobium kunmingense TaxID=1211806 RepID=A0A2N0I397_9SPHN|nr:phosphatidate cytidylyltransferase [Novosphingobium kunmingense]PKB25647.1 phosphatidate cytidylyltransferase [Novosphingobium kunmingense]
MAGAEGKASDLPTRALSALVMVIVAGAALWAGGGTWALFVAAVATGVYWEWSGLVKGFATGPAQRLGWMAGGFVYIVIAATTLLILRLGQYGVSRTLLIVGIVIAIDVCAYFSGRTFGGPKIAPRLSPKKTWAGLIGGAAGAALVIAAYATWASCYDPLFGHCEFERFGKHLPLALAGGTVAAMIAQAGDFFESWMKRRAGVKDSGKLIPGHGGLFDRVDGLMALNFAVGLVGLVMLGGRVLSGAPLLPGAL